MVEHKHLIIRAEIQHPPTQEKLVSEWMRNLVGALKMELAAGPIVRYINDPGNRGVTGVCIIKTSHIALHVWDEPHPAIAQLDVYTCGEMDVQIIKDALQEYGPVHISAKLLDRKFGLTEIT
jgi:S-adenosylmethionine/arginine decarboxylase-like enzyme